jgi:HEAT repeat protein
MPDETRSVADILTRGANADGLKSTELAELTSLDAAELTVFQRLWPGIETERRRRIITHLVDLAEDNIELNFDAIYKVCLTDPDADTRVKAVEGLWEDEGTSLIRPLVNLVQNDGSDRVRAAAASALGRFTKLGEQGRIRPDYVTVLKETLLGVLSDPGSVDEVRRRSLEALAPLSTPEVKLAITAAYEGGNKRLRVGALFAMGQNCDPAWMPILLSELGSHDVELRFEAATALGELGDGAAVPLLIALGNDPDSEVRLAVIQALGKIGGAAAREFLLSCAGSRNPAFRDAARHALDELRANGDPLSLPL